MVPARTRNWWLVYCVLLFYSDVSAYALQGKAISKTIGLSQRLFRGENGASERLFKNHRVRQFDGTCKSLVLFGGSTIPETSRRNGFDVFHRRNTGAGLDTWYQASHDPKIKLFYEQKVQKWVIGMREDGNVSIAIQFECLTPNPQDTHCGAHTSQNKDGSVRWIFDPTLHLECRKDHKDGRSKRFFLGWFIFAFISLVITAVPNVVKEVQRKEGCLYYTSVCEMRDDVEDLTKEIRRLQNDLDSFGDDMQHYSQLPNVYSKTKDLIYTIERMLRNIQLMNNKLTKKIQIKTHNASYLIVLDQMKIFSFSQLQGIEQDVGWSKDNPETTSFDGMLNAWTPVDFQFSFLQVPTTVNVLVMAAQVVLSITELIFTVTEEKDIKDKLSKNIIELKRTKTILKKQEGYLEDFKQMYISRVIPYLKRIVGNWKEDFPRFWSLLTAFSREDISMRNLALVNTYLGKVSDYFQEKIVHMMNLDSDLVKRENFDAFLVSMVDNGVSFETIYKLSVQKLSELGLPIFETQFNLLQAMAKVTDKTCYWGMNLENVRKGEVDESDWSSQPGC